MNKQFIESLAYIQAKLKAPKNQVNGFGHYNYRSCEDIMEAVKPLLADKGLVLTVNDDIVLVGNRFYVKATASITDGENVMSNSAFAREEESKKGMDSSQVTGATSSYARKYALNGLLCIDDNKDADTDEQAIESKARANKVEKKVAHQEQPQQPNTTTLETDYNKCLNYLKSQADNSVAVVGKESFWTKCEDVCKVMSLTNKTKAKELEDLMKQKKSN